MTNYNLYYQNKDSKVIISFATCYNTSGEKYLNGINSINEKIIISGGIASHDNLTTLTYVFTKDEIISNGAVAISLQNENLYVHNDFSYNWSQIGLELTVNEVEDNRVIK